ncbi:uncharacterized protein LOC134244371 [Saccostrea cucullata]|uniref:uncharacterized protein LOC134244371 n=1 Tax=Saccostrea cuccullata TaxID=36930 RepID=UPI002ED4655F
MTHWKLQHKSGVGGEPQFTLEGAKSREANTSSAAKQGSQGSGHRPNDRRTTPCIHYKHYTITEVGAAETVPGVRRGRHITHVTPDRVWIADGDDHKVKMIPYTSPWIPKCVYSSLSTGDLLVVMYRGDKDTSQVNRYTNTGEHIQTIENDNTENRNGDVIVSDIGRYAVVVTNSRGRHRFSYTGHPSGSGLDPHEICTDALSHILVCDYFTNMIHILDSDGRLLSQIKREQHGINRPLGLSYDNRTHCVWMGSDDNNTVNIHRLEHSLTV